MTIGDAIARIDALKHNQYTYAEKASWLSKVDLMITRDIIDTHTSPTASTFTGYTDQTDSDTELIAPAPYDELYIKWLEAQIDYNNGEYSKYNNSITVFNTEYKSFADWYNRTRRPAQHGMRFLF